MAGPEGGAAGTEVPMRRVAAASFAGTTIEFYDFFIYGTASALVFAPVFFPSLGPAAGTVASFASLSVAFFFRPVGSILFGHLGDRLGRKRTLIYTLLLMGLSTFAIGLLPTAASIGAAAPILLVVLRALQGVAVGGEWAGAALLTSEFAPAGRRGTYSMFPQLGPAIAFSLSSTTFLITALTMSPEEFAAWGWRVPFLLSIVLVGVGLYVRLKITETPVFKRALERDEPVKLPVSDALRHQWRQVLLAGGAMTGVFGFFYTSTAYLTTYGGQAKGVGVLGLDRPTVLTAGIIGGLVFGAVVVAGAIASDRFGRRRVVLIGNAAMLLTGPAAFLIMQPGSAVSFVLGLALLIGTVGIPYGPAAAYLPEIFQTRYRYTGAGMSYNLASVLGGATPLLVAAPLTAAFGGIGIGLFLTGLGVVSTVCVLALSETKDALIDSGPAVATA